MRLLDLSQPVFDGSPNCPAHPRVNVEITARHATDGWRLEQLSLASHTGSHLDAPLHKIAGGKNIGDFPLEAFVGQAWLVDARDATADQAIGADLLEASLPPDRVEDAIVLLATGWGDRRAANESWHYHSPYLAPGGAQWLVDHHARAVGIDHYSIGGSRDPDNSRTHEILLGKGLWIVEELRFPAEIFAQPQPLQFWALPINFAGFSGSFCRPVVVLP